MYSLRKTKFKNITVAILTLVMALSLVFCTACSCSDTPTTDDNDDTTTEEETITDYQVIKNGDFEYIKNEIEDIRDAIDGKTLKVIIETCYLTEEEIKKLTEICNETFVNFIKTSTGFGSRGASIEDIEYKEVTTLIYGLDVTEQEKQEVLSYLNETYPGMEVGEVEGKQDIYSFIISVE